MRAKEEFFNKGSYVVGNGLNTHFWEYTRLGGMPLSQQYQSLNNVVQGKGVYVASVVSKAPLNIGFRQTLADERWTSWLHLVQRSILINLTDDSDTFKWKLTASGSVWAKSMYADFMNMHTRFFRKYI
jgi:hypothetical protein